MSLVHIFNQLSKHPNQRPFTFPITHSDLCKMFQLTLIVNMIVLFVWFEVYTLEKRQPEKPVVRIKSWLKLCVKQGCIPVGCVPPAHSGKQTDATELFIC